MAIHEVVCVNHATSPGGTHQHISHLGVGNTSGYSARITVAQAIANLRSPYGDRYYTVSPTTGRRAEVIEGGCEVCGQRPYVRTTADNITDNNLSQLGSCRIA